MNLPFVKVKHYKFHRKIDKNTMEIINTPLYLYHVLQEAKNFRDRYAYWAGKNHNEKAVKALDILLILGELKIKKSCGLKEV